MARIKYAPGVDPIFGQIEGFVFQSNSYGQTMKSKPKMRTWKSTVQKLRNAYFTTANNNWKNMTIGSRTAWNNFANVYPQPTHHDATKFLNGYNLFVQRNYYKFLAEYQNFTFMDVPVFTSPLNDTFTAVAKLNAGVLTLEFTFTRGDSTLQCLMNVSKTNYPSLHYIGSGTRYVGSILNTNQSVDITDQYLSFYGQLPAVGDFIYVGLTQNSLVGGQTYFSAPVLTEVTAGVVPVKYGYLYSGNAILNPLNMAAAAWRIPLWADYEKLRLLFASFRWNFNGSTTPGTSAANFQGQCFAKANSFNYYASIGTVGCTLLPNQINTSGLSMPAGGYMNLGGVSFSMHIYSYIATGDPIIGISSTICRLQRIDRGVTKYLANKGQGFSTRICRDVPGVPDFTIGTYTGNDGRSYPTIVYAEIEIITCNLAETKYRDGSEITLATKSAEWTAPPNTVRAPYAYDFNNI